MKHQILLSISLLFIFTVRVQAQSTCCSPTSEFASLAQQDEFKSAHTLAEIDHLPTRGEWISLPCELGEDVRAWVVKSKSESNVWVLMIHEWWGLNGHIQNEAEEWSDALGDVNVIAVDMYDGKVATTRDSAAFFMQSVTEKRASQILESALNHIPSSSTVFTIGWCFGGGWSLQTAILFPKRIAACVMYYGMPETDMEKIKKIQAPVIGIFANKDGWITPDVVGSFENHMKQAGKEIEIHQYDAQHAFANPSGPVFDQKATTDAKRRVLTFLKKHKDKKKE